MSSKLLINQDKHIANWDFSRNEVLQTKMAINSEKISRCFRILSPSKKELIRRYFKWENNKLTTEKIKQLHSPFVIELIKQDLFR